MYIDSLNEFGKYDKNNTWGNKVQNYPEEVEKI